MRKYSRADIKWWKNLYEKFGSYNSVKNYIKEVIGKGPADTTIKDRLQILAMEEKWDFNIWEKRFKRNIKLQIHHEKEVEYWIKIYEEVGSFNGVSKYLTNIYGKTISGSNIKRRIKRKFFREGRGFYKWEKKFRVDNPTTFRPIYTDQEVNDWVKLFERIGYFNGVSNYLKSKKDGMGPDSAVIKYRILKKFERERIDSKSWHKKYQIIKNGQFEKAYKEREVFEWRSLYEELGSFNAICNYLKMISSERVPCHHTIIRRLQQKFANEDKDFNEWVITFFNSNHERANKIGQFAHIIIELIFIQFCLKGGLKGYYEISPSLDRDTIVDNALVDLNSGIKMICIDYTISKIHKNLFEKLSKKYQSDDRALIIVALTSDKKIKIPQNYPKRLKRNARIMRSEEFAHFMNYDGDLLKRYENAVELSKNALFNDNAYKILERESKRSKSKLKDLSKVFPISEQELIRYLKSGTEMDYTYIIKDLRFKKLDNFTGSSYF